ncbi:MAG: hypothetical protein A2Z72_03000 [Omnitrophica bacterium RBG_13_46_9]|nr:MAG: hypothetical protein A2Z72_03000 [Omnitrophica bacterium RBG_13_46_9]
MGNITIRSLEVIITVWIILWVNFMGRDLYRKKYLDEYRILVKCTSEEKRARTYGEHFYEFLRFAKTHVPGSASYGFAGVEDFSLASRRGIYYLYPCLKKQNPDYVLAYGIPGFEKDGFSVYARLDNTRFILKRE